MLHLRKLWLAFLAAIVVLALTPTAGWGQSVYGTITGNITDTSGAAVAKAAVTLTNLDTAEKRAMETDTSGNYTFVNILPGRYKLEGEKTGFKKFVREPIVVQIESGLRVDVSLQVGAQTEIVEVTGEAPFLQPETTSLGQVVEQRQITEMPLNGRNPLALVGLAPGVVPQGTPSAGNGSGGNPVGANPFALGDFQVGGGMAGQSQILIDGVPTNGAYLNVVTVIPTQDAIEEFKIQTNNLGPEYGRFAGGVINLSTRSGTNSFHGSAYEFLRNQKLNANGFFDNASGLDRPPFTQNQFGANVGGYAIKDKLFFFSSYEGFRQRKGNVFLGWVPTAAERTGDFSQLGSTNTTSVLNIYDPTTSAVGGNLPCVSTNSSCRTAFVGNVIPTNRIDPTAQALLTYMPMPNLAGSPNGNFAENYSTGGDVDQYNERIDYNLSSKQRLFGRYTHSNILSLPDDPYNGICKDRCTETTIAHQISLGDTIAFSPKTILDLHIGYTRYVYLRTPITQGIDMSKFGPNWATLAPQMTYTHIPDVCVSQTNGDNHWGAGSWCTQGAGSGIGAWDDTYSFTPSVSHIMGRHNIKVGGEFRVLRNNYYQSNDPAGLYYFDARMTAANPTVGTSGSSGNSGNGFASFLLGYGDNGNVVEPASTADQNIYKAIYGGDTIQVTRKITLNLGVRVDLQGAWTERTNRIVVFNPDETSPIGAAAGLPSLKGAYDLVASSQHPSRSPFDSWNHVSPRLGISYQLDKNTVIRTGYGIFYLPVDIRWNDAPHNLFINSFSTSWNAKASDGVTPKDILSNPFPSGITPPFGRNQAAINVQGSGNEASLPNNPAPNVQQWNLDIQHQFSGNLLVDVAYAGSKGTHLPMHDQTLNQLPTANLPTSSADVTALKTQVHNPFAGNCAPGTVPACTGPVLSGNIGTSPTIMAAQLLLPFPQFDNVAMAEPDNRDSIYHSMQAKVEKRFAAGASVLASYTVSKLIDNTNSEINWLEASPVGWNDANVNNLRGERSLDAFDVSQRFVLATVLDLPFGKGKKYANNLGTVAEKLVGGWGINAIITVQRGFPIIIGGCPGLLSESGVPNVGCSRNTRTALSHQNSGSLDSRLANWFDTSVFTHTDNYGYGTDSRTEPNIRTDGMKNFDFAVFKNTKFGPDQRLGAEFRAEFFNGFNHPQFSPPNSSFGSSDFGRVTGQYNLPRQIQFAMRFTF